jgi:dTDP-4-dehydrorhamnose 3,5-epimerase
MRFQECGIPGAFVVDLDRRADARGYFARVWCAETLARYSVTPTIRQVNTAHSVRRGTMRGMHFQRAPHEECKIVRCTRGSVFDVVLDLRPRSPTYCGWFGTELTAENGRQLVVPEGCAHGYLTLEDASEVVYTTSCAYAPDAATGVRHDDPAFGIRWPIPAAVVSEQDGRWPDFSREV